MCDFTDLFADIVVEATSDDNGFLDSFGPLIPEATQACSDDIVGSEIVSSGAASDQRIKWSAPSLRTYWEKVALAATMREGLQLKYKRYVQQQNIETMGKVNDTPSRACVRYVHIVETIKSASRVLESLYGLCFII